jgi:hypothetical protein
LNFRYGWTVTGESGELEDSGCYIEGIITGGNNIKRVDLNTCGGSWNEQRLQPGSYRVTVNVTTDWNESKSAHYDFRILP